MYLTNKEIKQLIKNDDLNKRLIIRPLLSEDQIGEMSVDLRIGTDFLVSFLGREPFIDAAQSIIERDFAPIGSFFSATRRKVGDTLILHPQQTVLCSSLEYLRFPNNVGADLFMRSSYTRLGLQLTTMIQAGYCDCISVELTNINNNPIKIRVGARLFQAKLFRIEETDYRHHERKYICHVRPEVSKANEDKELDVFCKFFKE